MALSTGSDVLDSVLGGGIPENRTVMVVGDPGTGKTTLGAQFLQTGLDAGESCLFVSTEQTPGELRASFESFAFDLNHENLDVATLHAQPGYTVEAEEEQLVLTDLDGETIFESPFTPPFSIKYIERVLSEFGPVDRVVFDSVSGLVPMTESPNRLRRVLLDLIRLFDSELDATALVTAESKSPASVTETLEYATHGVIDLRREEVETDYVRCLRVLKMRGVNHDTREYGIEFTEDGIRAVERYHTTETPTNRIPTGIDGFDRLSGGGLVTGGTTVFEHDGRATLDAIFASVLATHLERGRQIVLMPPASMTYDRLVELFDREGVDLDEEIEAGHVAVLDVVGVWPGDQEHVYTVSAESDLCATLERIADLNDRPLTVVKNVVTLIHGVDQTAARDLRYWIESELLADGDLAVDVLNQRAIADDLVEFYVEAAQQVLRTWLHRNGLQFITLIKGSGPHVGNVRLVEFIDEPPFVYIQSG